MPFIPHSQIDEKEMLSSLGISEKEELFSHIPKEIRLSKELSLPAPLSEIEVEQEIKKISLMNKGVNEYISFLGGGSYNHWIPSTVEYILSRGEIFSPYTPYQPEASQGTLTILFEFQTMMCELFDMEVSNASVYDGASALAEACLMALRITQKEEVIISSAIHPEYRTVVKTYLESAGFKVKEIKFREDGRTDLEALEKALSSDTAAFAIQNPNFFGIIEDIKGIQSLREKTNILLIACVVEPISLGLLTPPGSYKADIAVGEGKSFGIPLNFGGPYLGIFTSKMEYVRNMPGRIVGETTDTEGKRGFVLTLSTREQHIRRAKATSNICTNHNMCAIAATVYLASIGKKGFKKISEMNLKKAHFLARELGKRNIELLFKSPFYNEFAIKVKNPDKVLEAGLERGFLAGLSLKRFYPDLENSLLINVTEVHDTQSLEKFANFLGEIENG